ncbi:hypothetical protein PAXINDRAFT_7939 [Paxillus involutus ATCC 200175]|nr:hypothetical protein PAXINDRAFT_7939 [Paxillus involutus ATCC 200175]
MSEHIAQAIPSWPSQLCKDINKSTIDTGCSPIFDELNFDKFVEVIHNDWQGIVHPLGPMYYFNAKLNALYGTHIPYGRKFPSTFQPPSILSNASSVEPALTCVLLAVEPVYPYTISALRPSGSVLVHPNTLDAPSQRNFELLFVMESTASSIFGSRESLVEMTNILKDVECFVTDSQSRFLMEPTVFSYARILFILSTLYIAGIKCIVLISADHNQFLHYYGQPEACLVRSYSILPHQHPKPYGIFWLISVAALLGFPIFEFSHLNHVCVDMIVSFINIAAYINKTNSNVKFQMGLATVVLVVDSGILGIIATNFQSIPLAMCRGSFIACITCIITGLITGHLGERLKSPSMFTAGTLNNNIRLYTAAFSMPTSLCVMGLSLSLIAFFLGGGDPPTSPWASLIVCSSIAASSVLEIANSFGAV